MSLQEIDMWNKAKTDITTRNRLIEENLGLVNYIANKFINSGMDYEDLVHEGVIGLIEAIERFEPEKGFAFSTYATWWIRQYIKRSIDDKSRTIKIPSDILNKLKDYYKLVYDQYTLKGTIPSNKEIALKLDIPERKLEKLLSIPLSIESLNALIPLLESETEFIEAISYDEDLENEILEEVDKNLLLDLFKVLNPKEQEILKLRYGFYGKTYTLEEIVPYFTVSRERIRQIEHKALGKLKKACRNKKLTFKISNNHYGF